MFLLKMEECHNQFARIQGLSMLLLLMVWGCDSNLQVTTTQLNSKTCPSGDCEDLGEILGSSTNDRSKNIVVVSPKDDLIISQIEYSEGTTATIDGVAVEVFKSESGVLAMKVPGYLNPRKLKVVIDSGGQIIELDHIYLHKEDDFPLITADPSTICSDQPFYNESGVLVQGQKLCKIDDPNLKPENIRVGITIGDVTGSILECSSENENGCISNPNYTVTEAVSLSSKTPQGATIADRSGAFELIDHPACSSDGETSCTSNPQYRATLTSDLSSKVLIGERVGGITGTYIPDFPELGQVLSTDTVNGVAGTLTLPDARDVTSPITYGVGGISIVGTFWVPSASQVLAGIKYGAPGNIMTGTAIAESHTLCTAANQTGCVATSVYKTIDLSGQGASGATDLTSANFTTRLKSSSTFEYWDENGVRHTSRGDANLVATNIRSATTLFGLTGTVIETPGSCTTNGSQNCVSDGLYFSSTACNSNAADNCYLPTGGSYEATDFSPIIPQNIRSGMTIAGVLGNIELPSTADVENAVNYGASGTEFTGSLTLPVVSNVGDSVGYGAGGTELTGIANIESHSDCASEAQINCVSNASFIAIDTTSSFADKVLSGQTVAGVSGNATVPDAETVLSGVSYGIPSSPTIGALILPTAGNVQAGSGAYGNPSSQVTPSLVPDFPNVANVLNTDTVNGASGTLTLPAAADVLNSIAYGASSVTGTMVAPTTDQVLTGVNYGPTGSPMTGTAIAEFHSDCNGANQTGCLATSTYLTMDLSNMGAGGAVNLNSTNFNTRVSSSSTFEYWDEDGVRHTTTGDADLIATNIRNGVNIFGVTGSVVEVPASCSSPGSQDCLATGSYSAATSCSTNGQDDCFLPSAGSYEATSFTDIIPRNIRSGETIAGVTGNLALPATSNVQQSVGYGAAGTEFTGILTVPIASNVGDSVGYGAGGTEFTGTAEIEQHSNCTAESQTGCVSNASFLAVDTTSNMANKIILGQTVGGVSGAVSLPNAEVVLSGVSYGNPSSATTGSLTLPTSGNVLSGSGTYGNPSSPVTPSLVPDFASVANVLSTDTVNGVSGTLTLPAASDVLNSVSYGTGGSSATGTMVSPNTSEVLAGINYGPAGSPITGTAVAESHSNCNGGNQTGCLSTSTYLSIDLSNQGAGGAVPLNATNFDTRIRSASTFEYWDEGGIRHTTTGDTDISATNIRNGIEIFGVTGSVIETPAACSSQGSQDCVAGGSYYAATSCSANGQDDCFLPSGSAYEASDFTDIIARNIRTGETIAGVTGNLALPATSDVEQSVGYGTSATERTGILTVPTASNVADSVGYGAGGTQFSGTAQIESHTGCTTESQTDCLSNASFLAVDKSSGIANKVISGQSVAGVAGAITLPSAGTALSGTTYGIPSSLTTGTLTLPSAGNVLSGTPAYGNPSSLVTPSYAPDFPDTSSVLATDTVNGSAGTIATRGNWNLNLSFPGSGVISSVSNAPAAGDIRRGVQVVGVTGNYPSAASPLYRYVDSGATNNTSGTNITDLNVFSTDVRTSGTYEFWDSSGVRLTGTGDADITASNIRQSTVIHGITGSVVPRPSDCSSNGSQSCVATGSYYAATACSSNGQDTCYLTSSGSFQSGDLSNLSPANIKSGVIAAGTTGSYPSGTYTLPSASVTDDLDNPTFNIKIKSGTAFEYWSSDGTRQTGSGTSNITEGNIKSGVSIFGTTGTYTGP